MLDWPKAISQPATFERLKLTNRSQEHRILITLIEAEQLARTFQKRITDRKLLLEKLDQVLESVTRLKAFVDEIAAEQTDFTSSDRLSAKIKEPANVNTMRQGLSLINDRVLAGQRVAKEDHGRLGVTRKSNMKQASQNAAIGWLAEGVRRITGRPHHLIVADLAQIVLNTEVSLDRVKQTLRVRSREWRQPINQDSSLIQNRRVRLPKQPSNTPE